MYKLYFQKVVSPPVISSPGWEKPTAAPPSTKLPLVTASAGIVTATPAAVVSTPPPTVPPRNGSKLEHIVNGKPKLQEKYFDSNIEENPSTPPLAVRKVVNGDVKVGGGEGKVNGGDVTDKSNGGYRESWKARQDQQNTVVFNFTGSKKDVSHIENDGLDLSKRNEKKVFFFSFFLYYFGTLKFFICLKLLF